MTPEWKTTVRKWARGHGITHAIIEGAGPRKRMRIASVIARIDAHHSDTTGFVAQLVTVGAPAILVRDSNARFVAQIGECTAETITGRYDHRNRPIIEHRPVIA